MEPVTNKDGQRGFYSEQTGFIGIDQMQKVTNDRGERGYYSEPTGFVPVPQDVGKYPESVKKDIKATGTKILKEGARLGTELVGMGAGAIKGAAIGFETTGSPYGAIAGGIVGAGLGYGTVKSGERLAEGDTLTAGKLASDIGSGMLMETGGQAIPKVISGVAKATGSVAKTTLGRMSGTGTGAVNEAIESGVKSTSEINPFKSATMYDKALRGKIAGPEIVDIAKESLNTIKDARGAEYRALLQEVSQNKAPIDLEQIKSAVTNKLKNYVKFTEGPTATGGVPKAAQEFTSVPHPSGGGFTVQAANGKYITMQGGAPAFFQSEETAIRAAESANKQAIIIKPSEGKTRADQLMSKFNWSRTTVGDIKDSADAKQLKKIYDKVMNWGHQPADNTAIELDRLRRDLDNFYSDSSRVREFVANARDTVNNVITKAVPEYKEMTKGYSEATTLIKDIEAGLMLRKQGMSGRIVADQTLRRLTSSMRDNFALRNDLVKALGAQGGDDLAGMVAGYAMNSPIPLGLAGTGPVLVGEAALAKLVSPAFLPVLVASSPRVQGEFLRMFGKAKGIAANIEGIGPTIVRAAELQLNNKSATGGK
jgi:hypothetical protein